MKINILKCLYSLKKSTIHNWKKYLYQSNEKSGISPGKFTKEHARKG